MVDDYMLDKVLNKIKDIVGIEKFCNTKTLPDTDKLPDNIFLKCCDINQMCDERWW